MLAMARCWPTMPLAHTRLRLRNMDEKTRRNVHISKITVAESCKATSSEGMSRTRGYMAKSVTATPTMASGGLKMPEGRCMMHSRVPITHSSFQLHLSSFFASVIEQFFISHFISRFKLVSLHGHLYCLNLPQCPTLSF